ncbi:MAG: PfkB family carbohydrate kinase [Dehalococcoidia bacterium]
MDRTSHGWAPGGPSLYAAHAFSRLGGEVTLVTGLSEEFEESWLDGIADVRGYVDSDLPRYQNNYDRAGNRRQYLLAEGEPLELTPFLKPEEKPDIVFIAPAFHEFRRAPLPFRESLVGVSLQGPLRTMTGRQRIIPHSHPNKVAERFVRPGWIAFFSEEDSADAEALGAYISTLRAVAVLTRGYNGATLFDSDGSQHHWDAIPAHAVEPTGAGDCFASAFMFRLAETEDLESAMRFALAAGSLAVERPGLAGIPDRQAIEVRMTREAV